MLIAQPKCNSIFDSSAVKSGQKFEQTQPRQEETCEVDRILSQAGTDPIKIFQHRVATLRWIRPIREA